MKIPRTLKATEYNGVKDREVSIYQDGGLNQILQGFSKAVNKYNTSVVMMIDGRSGMGKTTLANQIALTLDPNFGIHKMHFIPQTFLEGDGDKKIGLMNAKKGDFILFDEAMIISNRSAMSQINKMIIQAMSMIRSKQIYVGFCVNSLFDLDKNLVLHRAEILLHVYGETLISRGRFAAFFRGKDGEDRLKMLYLFGKKFYSYSKPKANLIGSFTKEFVVDEKKYEVEKQIGVNTFLKGKKDYSNEKNRIIINLHKLGYSTIKIGEMVELSQRQVESILQKWRNTGEY